MILMNELYGLMMKKYIDYQTYETYVKKIQNIESKSICTMQNRLSFKQQMFSKLEKIYEDNMQKKYIDFHDAVYDVMILYECILKNKKF